MDQDKWSPALQIRTVLLSIQALLSAPNPDDPLDNNVAEQWKTNEASAIEIGTVVDFSCLTFIFSSPVDAEICHIIETSHYSKSLIKFTSP